MRVVQQPIEQRGGQGGVVGQCRRPLGCLLYTSDAADDLLCVDIGGSRIIKKQKKKHTHYTLTENNTRTSNNH